MTGTLDSADLQAYHFATSGVSGGNFSWRSPDGETAVLKIKGSKTTRKIDFTGEQWSIRLHINITASLAKHNGPDDVTHAAQVAELEKRAGNELGTRIAALIGRHQKKQLDIFGFGGMAQRENAKLWDQIKNNWGKQFKEANVQVTATVHLTDTGFIKNY